MKKIDFYELFKSDRLHVVSCPEALSECVAAAKAHTVEHFVYIDKGKADFDLLLKEEPKETYTVYDCHPSIITTAKFIQYESLEDAVLCGLIPNTILLKGVTDVDVLVKDIVYKRNAMLAVF